MHIRWFRFFERDPRYRQGSARERRIIELKISAALAVHQLRRKLHLTQTDLAERLGVSQGRISRLEQIDTGVSLDAYTDALLALGASDDDIARAFQAGACFPVKKLRERAALPYYPRPRPD